MAKNKNSKEILEKKKTLKKLLNEKKKIELEIKSSNETIQNILSEKISEYALNKLPIESIQDLYYPQKSVTYYFNLHSKERKNQTVFLNNLKKIEYKIQEAKIDLTIEKINNILKELN